MSFGSHLHQWVNGLPNCWLAGLRKALVIFSSRGDMNSLEECFSSRVISHMRFETIVFLDWDWQRRADQREGKEINQEKSASRLPKPAYLASCHLPFRWDTCNSISFPRKKELQRKRRWCNTETGIPHWKTKNREIPRGRNKLASASVLLTRRRLSLMHILAPGFKAIGWAIQGYIES